MHAPRSVDGFSRTWMVHFRNKSYYQCFALAMAFYGLWEIWKRRNALIHGNPDFCNIYKLFDWAPKVANMIPGGPRNRRDELMMDRLGASQSSLMKSKWSRWSIGVHGTCMNVAINDFDDSCKGGMILRDRHGKFVQAFVQSFKKTRPHLELLSFIGNAFSIASASGIKVDCIASSHSSCFSTRSSIENVPWDNTNEWRNIMREFGPPQMIRVTASHNNAAIALVYTSQDMTYNHFIALPIVVRRSIKADRLGLADFGSERDGDDDHLRAGIHRDDLRFGPMRDITVADDTGMDTRFNSNRLYTVGR